MCHRGEAEAAGKESTKEHALRVGSAVCPQDPDILQGRPPDEALMGLGQTGHVHEANSLSQRGHLREREASLCQGFPCPVSKEGRRLRAARPLQTCRPDAVIAGTPAPPWCHTLSHKTWRKWHMPCMGWVGAGGLPDSEGAPGSPWHLLELQVQRLSFSQLPGEGARIE